MIEIFYSSFWQMLKDISLYPSLDILFIELTLIGYPVTSCNVSINRDRWSWSIQFKFLLRQMEKFYPWVESIISWNNLLELLELLRTWLPIEHNCNIFLFKNLKEHIFLFNHQRRWRNCYHHQSNHQQLYRQHILYLIMIYAVVSIIREVGLFY